jgi:hypothetical protein
MCAQRIRSTEPFPSLSATALAKPLWRPRGRLSYEPMFDCKQPLTERLTNTVDLMIDFATLGEYGLEEPAGRTTRACEADRGGQPQESFREALFSNHRGPRRNATRSRGVREASMTTPASGVA